jgi:phosphoglycolate phosphatase-like HAD superfamily hydrolase
MDARTIIVDLDGTLADVRHRLHYLKGRKDWKRFFGEMRLDPLNVWCRALMRAMKDAGFTVAIVSGRPGDYADDIREWLRTHDVPYDALHTRRAGDFRPDDIVKKEILEAHFRKEDILFVVDDRPSVVAMWRREGLVCLQCEPHEP